VLIVYFFWMAAAAVLVALASQWWILALGLTVLGAALSLYHPAGLALITQGCRRRGRALGINGVAGSIGIAVGPALGKYLAERGEWRLAYIILAVASLLAGLAMTFLKIDESAVRQARTPPVEDGAADARRAYAPGLWLVLAAGMLGGLNYRCLVTALPNYLGSEVPGFSFLATGAVLTLVVLALGGVGQFIGGHLADRWQPTLLYVGLISLTVPLALVMANGAAAPILIASGLLAICMFAQQPVENTIIAQVTSARRRSTLFGVKFMLTFGFGALGTPLVGFIWQLTDSRAPAFDVFAGSALLMALLALWFRRLHLRAGQPAV